MARLSASQTGKAGTTTISSVAYDVLHTLSISTGEAGYTLSCVYEFPVELNYLAQQANSSIKSRVKRLSTPISTTLPFNLGQSEVTTKISQFIASVKAFPIEGSVRGIDSAVEAAFLADVAGIVNLTANSNSSFTDPDAIV